MRGPLRARDLRCEGGWESDGELLPLIWQWDLDAVARFAIKRYLAAVTALRARFDFPGLPPGGDFTRPDLRALEADLERDGERRLRGKLHLNF